jgi:methionine-rich copper-binding protein CopC
MLTFNGRVVVHLSSVLLVGGPRNTRVLLSSPQAPDADTLVYPLPTLSPGQYQAQWKTHGLDGKVMEGTLRFTVIEVSR